MIYLLIYITGKHKLWWKHHQSSYPLVHDQLHHFGYRVVESNEPSFRVQINVLSRFVFTLGSSSTTASDRYAQLSTRHVSESDIYLLIQYWSPARYSRSSTDRRVAWSPYPIAIAGVLQQAQPTPSRSPQFNHSSSNRLTKLWSVADRPYEYAHEALHGELRRSRGRGIDLTKSRNQRDMPTPNIGFMINEPSINQ